MDSHFLVCAFGMEEARLKFEMIPVLPDVPRERIERAMDFIIRKHCADKAQETAEDRAWIEKETGEKPMSVWDYDPEADFHWIKQQRPAYEQGKRAGIVYNKPGFVVLDDADQAAKHLLHPTGRLIYPSEDDAAHDRAVLKWFEDSPEFKDLVPSALARTLVDADRCVSPALAQYVGKQ